MKAICVDDEPLILNLTVSLCRELPELDEVEGFLNAQDALGYLECNTVDLALLDIDLPDMNGLLLAAKLKELQPNLSVIFLTGYAMYAEVLRENTYLSRTVGVQEGQKVVDTGLYGIIRHPMYTATILMFTMIPLILGSLAALPVFLLYPAIIVRRIGNEEQVLKKELPGYDAYLKKVKYRLFPKIW